jgi:vacuolar-type H+-ATPase subunit I/STV1
VMKLMIADTLYPFIQFPIAPWALYSFNQKTEMALWKLGFGLILC